MNEEKEKYISQLASKVDTRLFPSLKGLNVNNPGSQPGVWLPRFYTTLKGLNVIDIEKIKII